MTHHHKFNPARLARLNDPKRLEMINPEVIWSTLSLESPSVLVDIGAGSGFFARQFAPRVSHGKIYACDVNETMVAWMQENLRQPNIFPLVCEESAIPLEDGLADLVYMISVHHELVDPDKMLLETHRLLRQGGKMAVVDWRRSAGGGGPEDEVRVPEEKVVEQLGQTGFHAVTVHKLHHNHFFITAQK